MRGHLSGSQLQVCTQVRRVLATFTCEPAELQRTTKSSGQLPVYERHSPPGASFSSSAPISLSMDYPPLDIKANHWLPARESSLFWIQASTSSSDLIILSRPRSTISWCWILNAGFTTWAASTTDCRLLTDPHVFTWYCVVSAASIAHNSALTG